MAIIDKKGRLRGKVGNLVYRVIKNEKEVISGRSRRVKQTRATKESGLEFGLASSSAYYIRRALNGLTLFADPRMINRLNSTILRCIKGSKTKDRGERDLHDGDLTELTGFQFNVNSPVDQVLPVRPECSLTSQNRVKVHIPGFSDIDLKRPDNGYKCDMQLILTVINYKEKYFETLDHMEFPIEWDKNLIQTFNWAPEVQIPAGCIALVSLSLNYSCGNPGIGSYIAVNTASFNPAEIIGAFAIEPEPAIERSETSKRKLNMYNYRGDEMLKEIEKLRQRDPKYKKSLFEPARAVEVEKTPPLTKGRTYFKKRE